MDWNKKREVYHGKEEKSSKEKNSKEKTSKEKSRKEKEEIIDSLENNFF